MRKMKKINGFLVVRFNDREKRVYPELGSFGVIDAEQYVGDIYLDLDAMEYTDAETIEIAVEQARGLNAGRRRPRRRRWLWPGRSSSRRKSRAGTTPTSTPGRRRMR